MTVINMLPSGGNSKTLLYAMGWKLATGSANNGASSHPYMDSEYFSYNASSTSYTVLKNCNVKMMLGQNVATNSGAASNSVAIYLNGSQILGGSGRQYYAEIEVRLTAGDSFYVRQYNAEQATTSRQLCIIGG